MTAAKGAIEPLLRVIGLLNSEAIGLEVFGDQVAQLCIVINNQNPFQRSSLCSGCVSYPMRTLMFPFVL